MNFKKKLKVFLQEVNQVYYSHGQTLISDHFYHLLCKRVSQFSLNTTILTTSMLGIKSYFSFLTLKKKFLNKFLETELFILEPKIDGISAILEWKNGRLFSLQTRGTETKVEDKAILERIAVPFFLKQNLNLKLRGELCLSNQKFLKYNETFSHSRQLVLSFLKKKQFLLKKQIDFFVFDVLFFKNFEFKTQLEKLKLIKSLFLLKFLKKEESFLVVPSFLISKKEFLSVNCFFLEKELQKKLNVSLDGLVLKVNSIERQQVIGKNFNYPKWSAALKFNFYLEESFIAEIIGLIVSINRTGKLTLVLTIKEVLFKKRRYNKIFLNNYSFLSQLYIGSLIKIQLVSNLIPILKEVYFNEKSFLLKKEHKIIIPFSCPFCSSKIVKKGAIFFCSNEQCFEKKIKQLLFFVSKKGINIQFLSDKTLRLFFHEKLISSYSDFFVLKFFKTKIISLIGVKRTDKILLSIERTKLHSRQRFFVGFGLKNIGVVLVKKILKYFSSLLKLISVLEKNTNQELKFILKIGLKRIISLRFLCKLKSEILKLISYKINL